MKSLSRVRLLETPWTAAYQAPPSMGFSRQESWSGSSLPSPCSCMNGFNLIVSILSNDEAETPILWPLDAKNWLTRKDPHTGIDWRHEKKGMTEDEMVGWHHQLNGHEFEQNAEDGEGQGSVACCIPCGRKRVGQDWVTELMLWNIQLYIIYYQLYIFIKQYLQAESIALFLFFIFLFLTMHTSLYMFWFVFFRLGWGGG